MTILRPNFRKGLILKLNLSKHVLTKVGALIQWEMDVKTKKFELLLQHFHKEMH